MGGGESGRLIRAENAATRLKPPFSLPAIARLEAVRFHDAFNV